jgi:hypothetical protein
LYSITDGSSALFLDACSLLYSLALIHIAKRKRQNQKVEPELVPHNERSFLRKYLNKTPKLVDIA